MNKFVILFLSFLIIGCGPTLVTTGAKTAVEQQKMIKLCVKVGMMQQ